MEPAVLTSSVEPLNRLETIFMILGTLDTSHYFPNSPRHRAPLI